MSKKDNQNGERDKEFTTKIEFPEPSGKKPSDKSVEKPNKAIDPESIKKDSEDESKGNKTNNKANNKATDKNAELSKQAEKSSPFKRFILYIIMTVSTLGIWAKFKPLRANAKGGWGMFAFFLLLISTSLIAERFFKSDINTALVDKFGEDTILIPDVLFFESSDGKTNYKELYELESQKVSELTLKVSKAEGNQASEKLAESSSAKKLAIAINEKLLLEKKIAATNEQLKKSNEKLQAELSKPVVVPEIAFVSFEELDGIVGCTSKFAERKKKDIFAKDFNGKWVNFDATITKIHEDSIELTNKDNVNLTVELIEEGSGYDLLVDDSINITFIVDGLGSCKTAYHGHTGKF